jgi:hypothetical protein
MRSLSPAWVETAGATTGGASEIGTTLGKVATGAGAGRVG